MANEILAFDASSQQRVDDLLREIREIWKQYKIEVPKKRRPWPRSIKDRVFELWTLKVSTHTIGTETGLPVQTMYSLRQRFNESSPGFLPVPIIKSRKCVGKGNQSLQLSQLEAPGVTVVVRDDIRIEGLTLESVVKLLELIQR